MNYVSANKTKITGALLVAFGVLQTQSETIRGLLDERTFAWFTIAIGVIVAVLGFLNSGGSITPPGESESGRGNSPPPALFIALLLVPLLMASACAGSRSAYKAADNLEEYAYVVTEHYAIVLNQAANLRQDPTLPGDVLAAIQRADNRVAPAVLGLRPLVEAYRDARTAETEQALQAAVDRAIIALAELVREVKAAIASPQASIHLEGAAYARQAVLA